MKICCVGDNCIDYYVDTKTPHFGGNPVNVAVYCRRLGVDSSYVGLMGNDDLGNQFKEALENKGIDISHLYQKEGTTALTEVKMIDHERVLGDYDEGVFASFKLTKKDIDFISHHDCMITGIWSRTADDLKNITIPVVFDFADKIKHPIWKSVLPYVSYAFYSNDFLDDESLKTEMQDKWSSNLEVLICTRANKGSLSYDGKNFYSCGIEKCDVVDTMGAGDSYIAGFIVDYLKNKDIQKAMIAGTKNSAITISYQGAW